MYNAFSSLSFHLTAASETYSGQNEKKKKSNHTVPVVDVGVVSGGEGASLENIAQLRSTTSKGGLHTGSISPRSSTAMRLKEGIEAIALDFSTPLFFRGNATSPLSLREKYKTKLSIIQCPYVPSTTYLPQSSSRSIPFHSKPPLRPQHPNQTKPNFLNTYYNSTHQPHPQVRSKHPLSPASSLSSVTDWPYSACGGCFSSSSSSSIPPPT